MIIKIYLKDYIFYLRPPTPNKNNYYILKFDFSGMDITEDNVVEKIL